METLKKIKVVIDTVLSMLLNIVIIVCLAYFLTIAVPLHNTITEIILKINKL
ncbi:MAG: hypothetical protein FWG20_02170 [Candidatus Cloacimonetes bacterium]|nr:hypothetical protein [Candidatus Cloacimonadota bacterium]